MPCRWSKIPHPNQVQSTVLDYVIDEGHHSATIFDLALRFSRSDNDDVERAIRDLVVSGALSIDRGKVVPGRTAASDRPIG
jgi:hypothetical protein